MVVIIMIGVSFILLVRMFLVVISKKFNSIRRNKEEYIFFYNNKKFGIRIVLG